MIKGSSLMKNKFYVDGVQKLGLAHLLISVAYCNYDDLRDILEERGKYKHRLKQKCGVCQTAFDLYFKEITPLINTYEQQHKFAVDFDKLNLTISRQQYVDSINNNSEIINKICIVVVLLATARIFLGDMKRLLLKANVEYNEPLRLFPPVKNSFDSFANIVGDTFNISVEKVREFLPGVRDGIYDFIEKQILMAG